MNKTDEKVAITLLPVKELVLSPMNERNSTQKESLQELAASIEKEGILQPLIVRPVNEHYEVVAGGRRLKASLIVKLETLPCIIKTLNDPQALEMSITENLQRENVPPLEEAAAYDKLMKTVKCTVNDLMIKFGKNERYIRSRLKLLSLNEKFQKLLSEEKISLEIALAVCRLEPTVQKSLYESEFGSTRIDNVTTRTVDMWIQHNVTMDLNQVPFPVDDDKLTKAGSCLKCPKNSLNNAVLFPEFGKGMFCLDRVCFQDKMTTFILKKAEELRANDPECIFVAENTWQDSETKIITALRKAGHEVFENLQKAKYELLRLPYIPFGVKKKEMDNAKARYDKEVARYEKMVKDGKAIHVFIVNGSHKGTIVFATPIKRNPGEKSQPKQATASKAVRIEELKRKNERNKELILCKVYRELIESFTEKDSYLKNSKDPLTLAETAAVFYCIKKHCRYSGETSISLDKWPTVLDLATGSSLKTTEKGLLIFRSLIMADLGHMDPDGDHIGAQMIVDIAHDFYLKKWEEVTKKYQEMYQKRKEGIDKKLKELKA